ncbi:MAG: 50S ribosomal protein L9 [Albidovulum sp.]|nr:50S ribosomal protein L9 [Albidovulum sp.]MDE0306522.1 50S ribosomal protein L9 [Albidovulum sp.]MDE0531218.1 50S ribosomal protein L9 [Albidovulum sp.]
MEVILLERIAKLGQMGDTVRVKQGYARNFLLPQGKALRSTDANRKKFEEQRVQIEARNLEQKREAEAVAEKLVGQSFVVIRSASNTGSLYGSVTTRDIAEAAESTGAAISRRQIALDRPIKEIGMHPVTVVLHPEVEVTVSINVARSKEEAELQSKGLEIDSTDADEDEFDATGQIESPEGDAESSGEKTSSESEVEMADNE